jgi:glycosyltransferase involved in cell wall biosynthesis
MNILVFFPYNLRTVEQQSVLEMLVKQGHKLVLLTTCKKGYLHSYVEKFGVIGEGVDVNEKNRFKYLIYSFKALRAAIKKYNIEIVIAHQQLPALIAGVYRKKKDFRLIYVRHNTDEGYQFNYNKAKWLNRFVNALTPIKIAPSRIVKDFWINYEKVPEGQILRINYGYNFDQYERPSEVEVHAIRSRFRASLMILSIARFVSAKRHFELFRIVARLIKEGLDCKLICLGNGPLIEEMEQEIDRLNMQGIIYLLGRKDNVIDYIEAADVFVHLSSSEASNSAVKEAGLCKKPVIVCEGVGDFDEYIIQNQNGFLVNKNSPGIEAFDILRAMAENKIDKAKIGTALYKSVLEIFTIENIGKSYNDIIIPKTNRK